MAQIHISKDPPRHLPSAFDLFHLSHYNSFQFLSTLYRDIGSFSGNGVNSRQNAIQNVHCIVDPVGSMSRSALPTVAPARPLVEGNGNSLVPFRFRRLSAASLLNGGWPRCWGTKCQY